MASNTLLNVLINQQNHGEHYQFIYKDLQKIIDHGENKGDTRVRFVSRSLIGKQDARMRHVFLEFQHHNRTEPRFERGSEKKRFEKGSLWAQVYVSEHNPSWSKYTSSWKPNWKDEISIQLPNIPMDMETIIDHEQSLPNMYILGVRDCRHHVSDMLNFCYQDVLMD